MSSYSKTEYRYWLKKNWYYHYLLAQQYQYCVRPQSTILQVGCADASLLATFSNSSVTGVEFDEHLYQQACRYHSNIPVYRSVSELPQDTTFDYVILSCVAHTVDDFQELMMQLKKYCHADTRIIIDFYSYMWEPILAVAQRAGLKRAVQIKNWLASTDVAHILSLADFEIVTHERCMLMPYYIPFVSAFCNYFLARMPLINRLTLFHCVVARPLFNTNAAKNNFTVSVIVPCKNEKGNIVPIVERCPVMGQLTELIFIEGGSRDGTWGEIQRVVAQAPHGKKIIALQQTGVGKGDAVRLGFAHATGDILMILDADITTPPEEMPKFVDALMRNKGEFINGSRLVYGMETGAMRFLNMLANYAFGVIFSWLLGQKIKDTLCGTKVFKKEHYHTLSQQRAVFGNVDPFGDFDLLFGAARLQLKIIDMPVHYKARSYGTTQIRRFYHGLFLAYMSIIGFFKLKVRYQGALSKKGVKLQRFSAHTN